MTKRSEWTHDRLKHERGSLFSWNRRQGQKYGCLGRVSGIYIGVTWWRDGRCNGPHHRFFSADGTDGDRNGIVVLTDWDIDHRDFRLESRFQEAIG